MIHFIVRFAPLMLVLSAEIAAAAEDGRFRLRAREHYEKVRFEGKGGENANYEGFTNSINGWYEEPLHYSIGFVGSPIFAKLRNKDPMVGFAEEVQLVHLGIEAKGFLKPKLVPGFLRLGFYQATLTSYGDAGRLDGRSFLWGLGYEFKMFGVGLAPEMSWRHGSLDDGFTFSGTAPCIGVHFYDAL
jgi:hypothetical protein